MKPVGERLRLERQRQGLDLKQIAARLCINNSYLTAIESDDWEKLPGGFFRRSFVRQYAQHLGLDSSQFEEQLDSVLGVEPEVDLTQLASPKTPINVPPMPTASQRTFDKRMMVSIGALVAVVLGGAGLFAFWQRAQVKRLIPEVVTSRPSAPKSQTGEQAEFTPKPVIPASVKAPSTEVSPPVQSPSRNETVSVAALNSGSGLQVAASEPTWLEVTMNGKTVFMGLLQRGQSQDLRNAETARILVGNAGGVAMRWNGKDIGPIGPKGQVRRVVFSKESYEIQFPGKPASD
jgi:cytoskeleton protein RodZ